MQIDDQRSLPAWDKNVPHVGVVAHCGVVRKQMQQKKLCLPIPVHVFGHPRRSVLLSFRHNRFMSHLEI